ncbi:hypothetical protein like AT3G26040 [Hibiscus trionum]|uniref:Uncharacterized protein n=1 Tax=Hibiscus trionum TaxID=183268 RepID=A0A9W7JIH1_HIBTR|nr:hypothetical protein like AT3G26040 [Hibiscus trionum]
MEVKIISREAIKPSSPTPHHLRTHNLSILDQIEVKESIYTPLLLFFSSTPAPQHSFNKSHLLKQSLSKTLTHFYPFAGRLKDWFTIDCNDAGVLYTQAQLPIHMSIVLQTPQIELLQQLLPHDLVQQDSDQVLVAIQVNFFACGGIAVCVYVNHVVADGAATATFIKSWAQMASAHDYIDFDVVHDCSSLFPSRDLSDLAAQFAEEDKNNEEHEELQDGETVTKRLLFNGSKITSLRDEIGNGPIRHRPSRFEALAALIWSAMLSTTSEKDTSFSKVTFSINLRNRTNPPLPQQCIGNVYHVKEVEPLKEKTGNLSTLAAKLHDAIRKVDDEYVRKIGEGAVDYIKFLRNKTKSGTFIIVSWCRFPFYEVDFGWGKPVWCATTLSINRTVVFMDASDGEGVEAWITLGEEEMAKFVQDPGIIAYCSSS